jgi:hypothetical protein
MHRYGWEFNYADCEARSDQVSTVTKCKRCGRIIVRNHKGQWVLPHSKLPSNLCRDGVHPHEPDKNPGRDPNGTVTAIAVGTSVLDAGVI